MTESPSLSDVSRYERACDEAIAMCDGNLRSTIKALIMANEYLEAELQDLQAATPHTASRQDAARKAVPPDLERHTGATDHGRCYLLRCVALPAGR